MPKSSSSANTKKSKTPEPWELECEYYTPWHKAVDQIPLYRKGSLKTYNKKVCRRFYGGYPAPNPSDYEGYQRQLICEQQRNAFNDARLSDFFELLELTEQRLICHILFHPSILRQTTVNGYRYVLYNDYNMSQLSDITDYQFKDTREVYAFLYNLSIKEFVVDGHLSWCTCRYSVHPDLKIAVNDFFHVGLYLWTDDHISQLKSYITDLHHLSKDSRFINLTLIK